jgi:hypothetical protein
MLAVAERRFFSSVGNERNLSAVFEPRANKLGAKLDA